MTDRHYIFRPETAEILDPFRFESYPLNEAAKEIIEQLLEDRSVEWIATNLSEKYGIAAIDAETDIRSLITQLAGRGIQVDQIFKISSANSIQCRSKVFTTPIIHIIQNCNSPCLACDCWKTKGVVKLEPSALKEIIDVFASQGAHSIMVSGGEPLLHPDLREILGNIKAARLGIELNTNGYLLHKRPYLEEIGLDVLVVSVDGVDNPSYQNMRGKDWLGQITSNVRLFKKRSPSTAIGLRTTLSKHIFSRIHQLFELAESWEYQSIGFSPLDITSESFNRASNDMKRDTLAQAILPSKSALEKLIGEAGDRDRSTLDEMHRQGRSTWSGKDYDRCVQYYLTLLGSKEHPSDIDDQAPCFFPYTSSLVDYDGDIRPCFYSKSIGSIYRLQEVDWSAKQALAELRDSGRCINCRGKVFCR